ncbi:MAG: hypothetical protein APG08_01411 [Candidatus Methanofastidiosum methylothiophilum]|uniref:DUF370 domain-containing protein n=1 Tax=Candidatus Methanofastidiosum methylothiophilum TaxID=1705564 RepID=A0A150JF09_9EURY|nr:MAG: hypothetical protein AN188_01511 [Candidatus Methanofastidiosum methylthiophilus]HOA06266.1 hypothetical protein [Spirochaetota bacterium]KYC55810.1 MAG: hypothetical protein APG08_01411 [Candidatus Methanofastidiosum methylthiophilus]KYC56202.1 MAG: hypothetical protein APG09_01444 [Candidatus Methanofastidiosum methylthiophilus]HOH36019.1 hypothetical protein [Spirochaetota bacterium]
MFLHIGNREIISLKNIVGIFNADTLIKSEINGDYLDEIKNDTKSIIIDKHDEVTVSKLSSYTLIGRLEKRNLSDIKGGDII